MDTHLQNMKDKEGAVHRYLLDEDLLLHGN